MGKILRISLKQNFTPNAMGWYRLMRQRDVSCSFYGPHLFLQYACWNSELIVSPLLYLINWKHILYKYWRSQEYLIGVCWIHHSFLKLRRLRRRVVTLSEKSLPTVAYREENFKKKSLDKIRCYFLQYIFLKFFTYRLWVFVSAKQECMWTSCHDIFWPIHKPLSQFRQLKIGRNP